MTKSRWFLLLPVVAMFLLAATALPAHANGGAATLAVRAVVARLARIQLEQPSFVSVSVQDIARGYVDVDSPVQVVVRSNAQEGYTLAFDCECNSIRQAQVQGLAGDLQVGAATAYAVRPAAGTGMWVDSLHLRFRFLLAADARPGNHAWPIRISLMAS